VREVSDPVATARIRWLDPNTASEPGSTMGATAVFALGGDAEVIPDWPAGGQHFSILLTFTASRADRHEVDANLDVLDRQGAADCLREDAPFFVMAGPKPIGKATITSVLWKSRE
jgi:hypothetical protein